MLATLLSGAQDYKENVHLSLWTFKLLKIYCEKAGFRVIKRMGDSISSALARFLPNRSGNIGVIAIKVHSHEDSPHH